ncbi:GumC family protein [Mesorhizobium sp. ZMM04-5]|uniref:GumC family protein n=1 Tax=Mesorhizobium marinum TaxID=3228790 RepID=A0ABV3R3M4_9HYPH
MTRSSATPGSGMIDPLALVRFVIDNIVKIGAIALVLAAAGITLVMMTPFPYRATATVLVDPRSVQVTLQEDVLQPVGSDAAVLESMVQIMRSDGFLLTVMDKLDLLGGVEDRLSEAEQLKALARFKSNLAVERKGATYLVEISYKAATPEEAARIANSVASEFADAQNGQVRQATQAAGRALSERLVELRRKLNASEKAVADFAAEHGILYVDDNNTLQMRQLTELSAQLALARTETEAARARYQNQVGGGTGGGALADERYSEPAQLAFLRQQRAQLKQQLDQQSLTYGARHPRIAQTRQAMEGIDRQIREERQNLTQQLKSGLEIAEAKQKTLEGDIARLSSGAVLTDAAKVRLEALRREAAADRDIYEKFLARNKTTEELAAINSDNVKVVSQAVPPLRSSRPSIVLLAPVLGLLGAVAATTALAVVQRRDGGERRGRRSRSPDRPPPAGDRRPLARGPANEPGAPAQPRPRRSNALLMISTDGSDDIPAAGRKPRRSSMLMMAEALGDPEPAADAARRGSGH